MGTVVGLLSPGEMGASVGAALVGAGSEVLWVSTGRSEETAERAEKAGLAAVASMDELVQRSAVIVSVCPPHAAVETARAVNGFSGLFVDLNAVAPMTAREIGGLIEQAGGRYVDGGIIGIPPSGDRTARIALSGASCDEVVALFAGSAFITNVLSERAGDASALKATYAAFTKGTSALILAVAAVARDQGVEEALYAEWGISSPELSGRLSLAAMLASSRGWRWVGEMNEIADMFAESGIPDGFHRSAAELYDRIDRFDGADDVVDRVLSELLEKDGTG